LLVSLILGSIISLFQAATQINEATLTIVPKILATVVILAVLGSWMGGQILTFTTNIFKSLPALVH
jgi:flagellar biosynthetic protein FliQ